MSCEMRDSRSCSEAQPGALGREGVGSGQVAPGSDPRSFPRFHRGRGGPIGSSSDRGKLTRGFRAHGLPPIPVVTPDVPKLPWKFVDGAGFPTGTSSLRLTHPTTGSPRSRSAGTIRKSSCRARHVRQPQVRPAQRRRTDSGGGKPVASRGGRQRLQRPGRGGWPFEAPVARRVAGFVRPAPAPFLDGEGEHRGIHRRQARRTRAGMR